MVTPLPELFGKLRKLQFCFLQCSLLWASTSFTTKTRLEIEIGTGQVLLLMCCTKCAGLLLGKAAAEQLRLQDATPLLTGSGKSGPNTSCLALGEIQGPNSSSAELSSSRTSHQRKTNPELNNNL